MCETEKDTERGKQETTFPTMNQSNIKHFQRDNAKATKVGRKKGGGDNRKEYGGK